MLSSPPHTKRLRLSTLSSLAHLPSAAAAAAGEFSGEPTTTKSAFSYNALLSVLAKSGRVADARRVFDEMPQRDVVSWNAMISGYLLHGRKNEAFCVLYRMQEARIRVSGFTLSITASSICSLQHAKQLHGIVLRNGLIPTNTVVANTVIGMYGRVGLSDYARAVFNSMEEPDVVSWNSMLSVFKDSRRYNQALECFYSMRGYGFPVDEFTISTVINVCADIRDLAEGEKLLALCFKMGFLRNSIVSSAVIDLYCACNRMLGAVRVFGEIQTWDSALCNSMISCYARKGLTDEAMGLFAEATRKGVLPNEITFTSILRSHSSFGFAMEKTQIHCWICKLGLEADLIISSALVDMYSKLGSIESALKIFYEIDSKDLVSWNTMILGLAQNGRGKEALSLFGKLLDSRIQPDRITLHGVLLACSSEGMVNEGKRLFSLMDTKYRVTYNWEHCICVVDMMGRAGRCKEALGFIDKMPYNRNIALLETLLEASRIHGNLEIAELVAERMVKLGLRSSLPYTVLAELYGSRGRWESVARVWKHMKERVKKEFFMNLRETGATRRPALVGLEALLAGTSALAVARTSAAAKIIDSLESTFG
ncbi:Pentatricopeptide repeat-containing protein, mitochondrial [Ananas comosus]|uniref:Pentatricopeptide repeat-containing protein, mitochondrial n=1 Tax=Ananas comosus TaxID=4615 RepID=A0A199W006_ANACO|nr:Pentatricopeptide repeat-containing protein, mitochondrial [Ananas comosus]